MEVDYPANNSMDTWWFAVDREGHVGAFFSGENGPIPAGTFQQADLLEFLRLLRGDTTEGEEEDFDWDAGMEEAAQRGLFVYEYPEEDLPAPTPYGRLVRPKQPLHADQLPPRLRKLCKRIKLGNTLFPASEHVQPVEHMACEYWSDVEVAYLAEDRKTFRPIPGKEKQFADFVAEFRNDFPKEAKKFRFEGIEDQPPPPPRRRRKKG